MPVILEIPNEFGYVLATAVSSVFVNMWHGSLTGKARKLSKIDYPNCYASDELAKKDPNAFKLNCAQRAHANFTENLTPFMTALFVAGLRFPVPAAAVGAGWLVSRIVYASGYVSNGPSGRLPGAIAQYLCYLPLIFMAAYTGVQMVLGN